MKTLVSTVGKERFEKYGVVFPPEWDVRYVKVPYTDEQLIEACRGAEYLFVGSVDYVTEKVIRACPQLKLIQTEGSGFDKVDTETARELKIPVCHNRNVNNGSVAEHCIGLILAAMRHTAVCNAAILSDGYLACQTAIRAEGEQELIGKHVGLIGIGAIGREVAKRLAGWECRVSYYDVFRPAPEVEEQYHVDYLSLEELVSTCDIISMHVPVLPGTIGLLSADCFARMKPTAYVINVARGEVIDQDALAKALEEGRIAGAALDTIFPEPVPAEHPLLNLSPRAQRKLTITPHVAGTTDEAFTRMLVNAIANFERVEKGEAPVYCVNQVV